MKALTRLQVLEKQNKDLRTRLENRQGKAELSLGENEGELKELRIEVRDKGAIIAMLQKEISSLAKELMEAKDLRAETVQARIDAAVAAAAAPLLSELEKAYVEIARLKAVINKDSSNSSKPPSQSGFKRHAHNSREKSGRQIGGQPSHPGHRLGLPANMDELVEKGIVTKLLIDHTGGAGDYISRFVIDVEVVTTITEHRFAVGAELPEDLYNEVSYGGNIRAMSVLLLNEGVIAEKRFSDILAGLSRGVVTISPATLERFQTQFAKKLEDSGELEAIKQDLLNGEVMHTDDTPMRCVETIEYLDNGETVIQTAEGKSFDATVRTSSNDRSPLYTVNPKKDHEGVERDDVLPGYLGTLSHDHESKFYNYGIAHSTCGEHLLRDLKGLWILWKIPWAEDMRAYVAGMNRHKNRDLLNNVAACDPVLLAGFERRFDELLESGRAAFTSMKKGDFGFDEFRKMLNRLTDFKDCYLLFMRNYKAPFTNNMAERDLRAEKTRQKVSLSFRSWGGISNHVKIRSFISTSKKRKKDLFAAIAQVLNGWPVLREA
ncbi:MAG: transposase [Oscillospiraceae bacterium]|jgi:hypothetical protein|nr:transposase [Oscillospiraceae bacterium]